MQKFDELVKRELSKEMQTLFPDSFISITQVHVSKDLSFAKIWLTTPTKDIDIMVKQVQAKTSDIRRKLSQKIIARKVPNLYFVSDKTEEHAQKIENLLSEIKHNDK
jgi:ribosome-binding factor A